MAAWSVLLLVLACDLTGSDDDDETTTTSTEAVTETETAGGGGGEAAGGGGACSRIAACCRAYVAAMGAGIPANTCDAYNSVVGMPDATCEQTMAGYRQGLQAMQKSVPSECN